MASRSDRSAGLAPTNEDLAQAYAAGGEELAGHAKAEAVLCDEANVTVLCTVSGHGGRERTVLLRLDGDGDVAWRRAYGDEHGAGRAIAPLPGGGYVVAGELQRGPLEFHAHVVRVDVAGEVVENRSFGDGGLSTVAVLADGSTLAGGGRQGKGLLLAGDAEEELDDVAEVVSVAASADGGFALAATQERSTTALGLTRLAAFWPDRSERWARSLPSSGRADPAAVVSMADGGVVVIGHREPDGRTAAQLWIVLVNASGEPVWEKTLAADGETRRGRAVALLPGGDVAVAGDAASGGERRSVVARLRSDGTTVWEQRSDEHDEIARGLAAAPDGLVLAGSTTATGAGRTQALVRRLDGDGDERWTRTFGLAELDAR